MKFVVAPREAEYVGHYGIRPRVLREYLRAHPGVYPNNLAELKWFEPSANGRRRYETGSYAYWPEGLFGRRQTHIRLFPDGAGTSVLAHDEVAPLGGVGEGIGAIIETAWVHYRGETLDDASGSERAGTPARRFALAGRVKPKCPVLLRPLGSVEPQSVRGFSSQTEYTARIGRYPATACDKQQLLNKKTITVLILD